MQIARKTPEGLQSVTIDDAEDATIIYVALSHAGIKPPENGSVIAPGKTLTESQSETVLAALSQLAMEASDEVPAEKVPGEDMTNERLNQLKAQARLFVPGLIDDPA